MTVEQLERERAIWVPSYDIYITAGEPFVDFSAHMASLEAMAGTDRFSSGSRSEPEASYEQYTARWEDMGSPLYTNRTNRRRPHRRPNLGQRDSKFGVDRGAGVWNDYGNPDHFRFWFEFGDLTKGIIHTWKEPEPERRPSRLTTVFERDGVRYEVEQFAYPLNGPPGERRGDIPMVLLQKVRAT